MFVKIDFNSAKIHIVEKTKKDGKPDCSDVVGNFIDGYHVRNINEVFSKKNKGNRFGDVFNPICMEQVSNMLHVFLGERPVSTLHPLKINGVPIRKRIPMIDDIAKNGYFRIDTKYLYTKKNGEVDVYSECVQGKKCRCSNSQQPLDYEITFLALWNYFTVNGNKGDYQLFLDILSKYTNKKVCPQNYSTVTQAYYDLYDNSKYGYNYANAYNACKKINGHKYYMLSKDLNAANFPVRLINGTFHNPSGNTTMVKISTNVNIQSVVSLDGSFIFEVSDEIYKRLIRGKKFAKFLDDGAAKLTKWTEFYNNDYGEEYLPYQYLEDNNYTQIQ